MLDFAEHFTVGGVKLGTAGIIIESIDDVYTGPDTRGQDTPRVYMPGSFAGLRVAGAAEYNFRLVVSGHTDAAESAPGAGVDLREQAHRNLDALKRLADSGTFNQPKELRWYGRPGTGSEPYLSANVYFPYGMSVRQIGEHHFRVALTAINPRGYWVGTPVVVPPFTSAASGNYPTFGTFSSFSITLGGNIDTTEVFMIVDTASVGGTESLILNNLTNGTSSLAINRQVASNANPIGPALTDLILDVPFRAVIATDNWPSTYDPSTDLRSDLLSYTDQRLMTLSPGTNNMTLTRNGTAAATITFGASAAYV